MRVNPRQMQRMMKQMGMKNTEIDAEEVIIKCRERDIVITSPSVTITEVTGQKFYQISGNEEIRESQIEEEGVDEDDVEIIVSQTGCTKSQAVKALKEVNGNIAEAILKLQV